QAGQEKHGMQTMNQSLLQHYMRRTITLDMALGSSTMPDELQQMIQRAQAAMAGARRPGP
ncbi:MAG TPA: type IV pili twitching motility protein PilT, partial [Candidatus Methylomirabilis sp.]